MRQGRDLEIAGRRSALRVYRAAPAAGHGVGVLVLHEAFGLVDHIRDVCDRLARHGFVAMAPDFFGGRSAESLQDAVALAGGLSPERVGEDLDAAVEALLSDAGVDGPKIGVVGFCMGGHLALLAAARSPRVGAAVDFYGMHPGLPLVATSIRAPVLLVFAERDEIVGEGRVAALREQLAAAGVRFACHVEPGVAHAFMNDSRPDRYDATAAAAGWDRLLAFLRAELA